MPQKRVLCRRKDTRSRLVNKVRTDTTSLVRRARYRTKLAGSYGWARYTVSIRPYLGRPAEERLSECQNEQPSRRFALTIYLSICDTMCHDALLLPLPKCGRSVAVGRRKLTRWNLLNASIMCLFRLPTSSTTYVPEVSPKRKFVSNGRKFCTINRSKL